MSNLRTRLGVFMPQWCAAGCVTGDDEGRGLLQALCIGKRGLSHAEPADSWHRSSTGARGSLGKHGNGMETNHDDPLTRGIDLPQVQREKSEEVAYSVEQSGWLPVRGVRCELRSRAAKAVRLGALHASCAHFR